MVNKIKTIKSNLTVFLGLILFLVSLSILPAGRVFALPSANFGATDDGIYGNGKSWYPRNFETGLLNVSSDTTQINFYLNGAQKGTNTKVSGFTGLTFDTTSLANGVYHVTAKAYNASGQIGTVMALDGNDNLTITVANAPSAKFMATDNGIFGNALSWYPRTFMTNVSSESSDIKQITYYLNGVGVAVDTTVNGAPGYSVDATTLTNGIYHLTATAQDSDGNMGSVTANDGNDNLTFTVSNSTANASGQDQTCNSKQQDLNTITTRVVKRSETQLETVDSIAKAVEQYYAKQGKKLADYAGIVSTLNSDENDAQNSVISLVSSSIINCNEDLSTQLSNFSGAVTAAHNDIKKYINDAQSLISQLEAM